MKHENNIENYFDRVKQNPPLISIEKVHQLLNKAEVKTKVKKGRQNLLKFTIMTTIFAVIISAVMLWPKGQEEIPKTKFQIPIPMASIGTKDTEIQISEPDVALNSTKSKTDADIQQSQHPFKEMLADIQGSEIPSSQIDDENNTLFTLEGDEKRKVNEGETMNFDSIQPIDGSRFILKLSNDELKEIGFGVTDTLISFIKCIDGRQFIYDYRVNIESGIVRGSSQTYLQVSRTDNPCQSSDKIKPSCQTNSFFSDLKVVDYFSNVNFNMVNDTLLPIIVPRSAINPEEMDDILWFAPNDYLLKILSKKHKPVIDEFLKYKKAKQAFPTTDLISYKPPKLIDDAKVLHLTLEELEQIGFQFYTDSTKYRGSIALAEIELFTSKISMLGKFSFSDDRTSQWEDKGLSVLVTRKDGSPYQTYGKLIQFLFPNGGEYGSQFPLLIPVLVKSSESFFIDDVIFWFLPTEGFFNALPDRISNDLRKEYNYVIADDKSTIEKPECKYFDECKNTLDVSIFKVFPNPANNKATVSFTLHEAINGRITLVDLAGRERQVLKPQTSFSKGSHQFDVDVSSVSEGIYLLTLYSDKGIQTQRFIVAR